MYVRKGALDWGLSSMRSLVEYIYQDGAEVSLARSAVALAEEHI